MEEIAFTRDTVLSDVHLYIPHKRHLMVRLNTVGQPVFLSLFKILWREDNLERSHNEHGKVREHEEAAAPGKLLGEDQCILTDDTNPNSLQEIEDLLDEDGDLEVTRRPRSPCEREEQNCSRDVVCPTILTIGNEDYTDDEEPVYNSHDLIRIEHTMATPLEDVGKQIWRGAFLLADYVLWKRDSFRGCTVLELGAGTGFTSIVMATVAKTVYCTGGEVKVKELDWLRNEFSSDTEAPYSWSEEEIAELYDHTTVILAADVVYDDDFTDALFKTLYRITHTLRNPCTIYFSIERRLNFTLRHMDITCDAYNHFRCCLNDFENIRDGKMKLTAEVIKPAFPQFFSYERINQLELWKIIAEPHA
ncbi:methyltransferase-like protein 22 isoform X2 [Ascaphus truei]|uniref:methyltransferase-like protein 22 isoform X2 n=1 Tax=Ascaphus truei TaxID=8439 RepID=UPI003F5AA758